MANEANIADHWRTTPKHLRAGFEDLAKRIRAMNLNPGFVYFIGSEEGPIKIGYSTNPERRLRELQTFSSHKLTILATKPGGPPDERVCHHCFAEHRLQGEWFSPHPMLLDEIERIKKCR